MKVSRAFAMPNKATFTMPPVVAFLGRWCNGVGVDPFSGWSTLATHRNDIDPDAPATHHLKAPEFCEQIADDGVVADYVLFDPPYSPRQISECYKKAGVACGTNETQNARLYAEVRRGLARTLRPGGVALSFGWNSVGFGKDWPIEELLLVYHGGAHNDTICVAQRKPIDLLTPANAGENEVVK